MTDRHERSENLRRGWRRFRRLAIQMPPGLQVIGWGYHTDVSMVVLNHQRRDIVEQEDRRHGRRLSAFERETWRTLEKSLRSAQ